MKRILVPVDFSKYSKNALYYAVKMAADIQAEILLFHTMYNFMSDNETNYDSSQGSEKITQEILHGPEIEARKEMDKLMEDISSFIQEKNLTEIKVHYKMEKGVPDENIVDAVKDNEAELIIMGTRGKGNAMHQFFGSIAARIMEKASVPVLVIPEDCTYRTFKNVLYATNFDHSDENAIVTLIQLLNKYETQIHAVHVSEKEELANDQATLEGIKTSFEKKHPDHKVSFEIIQGVEVVEAVNQYVDTHQIELLAMLSHKRNLISRLLHPSVTKKMLFHSETPLLAFHGR